MRYLVDTHVIIWLSTDSYNLPNRIIELIESSENEIYVCSVSLWEIAIKLNLGKLDLKRPLKMLFDDMNADGFNILPIEDQYLCGLLDLPYIHKDPFDRLIISTAMAERLTIITADENIQKYDVPWVW